MSPLLSRAQFQKWSNGYFLHRRGVVREPASFIQHLAEVAPDVLVLHRKNAGM